MRTVRFTWLAALLLCLGGPTSVSAQVQTDSGDPTILAFAALDAFEAVGLMYGAPQFAQGILPCADDNVRGGRILDGLLERTWSEPRTSEVAEVLGELGWDDCPDSRIDRWISDHLLAQLPAGAGYEEFWQAVSDREAPNRLGLWTRIAGDESLSGQVRSRAMSEVAGVP